MVLFSHTGYIFNNKYLSGMSKPVTGWAHTGVESTNLFFCIKITQRTLPDASWWSSECSLLHQQFAPLCGGRGALPWRASTAPCIASRGVHSKSNWEERKKKLNTPKHSCDVASLATQCAAVRGVLWWCRLVPASHLTPRLFTDRGMDRMHPSSPVLLLLPTHCQDTGGKEKPFRSSTGGFS